jgi:N-terminal domain of oxidoreductase
VPRQIVLASRPSGFPVSANFQLTETDRPDLADGQVRVHNLFMSVDPYMRGRMNDGRSYVPPFRLGEPLEGGAVGTVIESRSPDLSEGDLVLHMLGWRDEAVLRAASAQKVAAVPGLSPSAYLDGLDSAPDAFISLFHGGNTGKMIIRLGQAGTLRLPAEFALDHRDQVRARAQPPQHLGRDPELAGRFGYHRPEHVQRLGQPLIACVGRRQVIKGELGRPAERPVPAR